MREGKGQEGRGREEKKSNSNCERIHLSMEFLDPLLGHGPPTHKFLLRQISGDIKMRIGLTPSSPAIIVHVTTDVISNISRH